MRKRTHLLILLLTISLSTMAETIVLKTGAHIQGTVLFANDEAVVVRDAKGSRFQYPRADIAEILDDATEEQQSATEAAVAETPKKVTIGLEVGGGVAIAPSVTGAGSQSPDNTTPAGATSAGVISADLIIGTHNLLQHHIVLGGSFGYRGIMHAGVARTYLPLQLVMRAPLMEQKHAPVMGVHAGYCFAADKQEKGGIIAGANIGYRCALNDKLALMLLADVTWQQLDASRQTIVIGDDQFTGQLPASRVHTSLKLGLYF